MAAGAWRLLGVAALLAAAAGCGDPDRPRPVSAELADETPDRVAGEGETILIALDRHLPDDWSPSGVKVRASPEAGEWTAEARRGPDGRTIEVVVARGSPDFRFEGIHGKDPGATGLGVDLGDGTETWIDLQVRRSLPVLEGAVWEDASPPGGNMVVDRGDRIRLVFDRAVELRPGEHGKRVRTPQDIVLSKASDRLDDGVTRAVFEKGEGDREVRIVLGSRPTLTVAGSLGAGGAIERFRQTAPSGLAVNGTAVLPMPWITARGGGPGAVSEREVDIRHADGFPQPRAREGEPFPAPGNRFFHTVTPIAGGRAIVAGGESAEGRQAIDQVLVYNPFHPPGEEAFRVAGRLPHPSHSHTATVLAGPDDTYGTADDAILIAGGSDGSRSLGELTVLRPVAEANIVVEPLESGLRVPRSDHAAAAIAGNRVIVDGGRSRGVGLIPGLVGCAEILTIGFEAGKARVVEHFVFRTLARSGHTLTMLPAAGAGGGHVLAYGGFGRDRRRFIDPLPFGQRIDGAPGEDAFWPQDERTVLISPVIIDLRNPEASITEVPYEFSLPLLRWGHQAFLIEGAGGADDTQVVLIAGGSLRHPVLHFDGGPDLWELPRRPRESVPGALPELPQGHEAASAILFRHDPRDPSRSRLEVVPHPSPDPGQTSERLSFAGVPVPGLGVVLLGGEEPGGPREVRCLDGAEVFLAGEEELAEMAFRLAAGRARHQAYLVETDSTRSIFLIGGIPGSAERTAFNAVEEVPLR